jgi:hypothetical protein
MKSRKPLKSLVRVVELRVLLHHPMSRVSIGLPFLEQRMAFMSAISMSKGIFLLGWRGGRKAQGKFFYSQ